MKTEDEIVKEIFEEVEKAAKLRFGLITKGCFITTTRDQKFTFTGELFITKGKKYKVLDVSNHPGKGMTIVTETNFPNEKAYHSPYGIDKIIP
jgi:hypothetical protein